MRYNRMVVAYHGCDSSIAELLLSGEPFKPSNNTYDWLGDGIYFWEYGADRTLQFAREQVARGKVQIPACVGALIQLGKCFDLLDTRFTRELAEAYEPWTQHYPSEHRPLPRNAGQAPDFKRRLLDRTVLNWYLDMSDGRGERFDTVRCGFPEGGPVYPGSGILAQTHIQLTVRNPGCNLGVFRPNLEKA